MNEHEFQTALRTAMRSTPEPPPMSDAPVLDAAHRDRRRRRTLWAGAGSAVAVAGVLGAAMILVPAPPDNLNIGSAVPRSAAASPNLTTTPPANAEPTFPNGQPDRTARSGPRYEKGVDLLAAVNSVLASRVVVTESGWSHLAQYEDTIKGTEVWSYQATVPVAQDDRFGSLHVTVYTPGNKYTGNACDIYGPDVGCSEEVVGGVSVGSFTGRPANPGGMVVHPGSDQWAVYRYEDGTVVVAGQEGEDSRVNDDPATERLPLTPRQLAEVAADPRLHIT